jgi:hypothetical protein
MHICEYIGMHTGRRESTGEMERKSEREEIERERKGERERGRKREKEGERGRKREKERRERERGATTSVPSGIRAALARSSSTDAFFLLLSVTKKGDFKAVRAVKSVPLLSRRNTKPVTKKFCLPSLHHPSPLVCLPFPVYRPVVYDAVLTESTLDSSGTCSCRGSGWGRGVG